MTAVHNVEITVLSTPEATVAEARSAQMNDSLGENFTVNGYAKKHPKDKDNPEIGFNLAVARALVSLADEYAMRAAKAVGGSVEVGGYEYTPAPVPAPGISIQDYINQAYGHSYFPKPSDWSITMDSLNPVISNYLS